MKKKIQLQDQLPIESTRALTPEGYLKATAAITTIGVQQYLASEFGANTDEPVGVYRPAETVFHPETIQSIKLIPITMNHPTEDVDAGNHSRLAIGTVGESVEPIDELRLGASIIINEDAVVKAILAREIEELSLGYDSYIIAEEGNYNGEPYFYRFEGPMIVNHLALVDEGRCGDSVKILDKNNGGNTMKKRQIKKFLKKAGMTDAKLEAFCKDVADDADIDNEVFEAALQDIDMEGIMPMIVKELMPMIQKEVKGNKNFMSILAKEIAATMTAGGGEPDPAAPPLDAEPEPEKTPEELAAQVAADAEEKEKEVTDAAMKRAKLVDSAKPFIQDKDIHTLNDREILEEALTDFVKPDKMKACSDEYLHGILDSITKDRTDSVQYFKDVKTTNNTELSQPITGLDARNLDDEGGK